MSDFCIGDRVVIREWDDMLEEFKATVYQEGIDMLDGCIFSHNMKHLCGRTATIIDIYGNGILLDFDDKSGDIDWKFTTNMIKPIISHEADVALYMKLVNKFQEKQVIVAIEELSELQKELCKALRGRKNTDNLAEEIADVYIMLEQMMIYFNISKADVDSMISTKLARTKERYGISNV